MRAVRLVTMAAAIAVTAGVSAQSRPNFSGTWVFDVNSSSAGGASMSASGGGMRGGGGSVSGGGGGSVSVGSGGGGGMSAAGSGGGAIAPRANTPPEISIEQTATSLTIERVSGENTQKFVHTFDGKENVNVNGRISSKTKSHWDGAALVTVGSQVFTTSDSTEMVITVRERRSLAADGSLILESERTTNGNTNSTKQVYRKKTT